LFTDFVDIDATKSTPRTWYGELPRHRRDSSSIPAGRQRRLSLRKDSLE
jgi:hypothetical protein